MSDNKHTSDAGHTGSEQSSPEHRAAASQSKAQSKTVAAVFSENLPVILPFPDVSEWREKTTQLSHRLTGRSTELKEVDSSLAELGLALRNLKSDAKGVDDSHSQRDKAREALAASLRHHGITREERSAARNAEETAIRTTATAELEVVGRFEQVAKSMLKLDEALRRWNPKRSTSTTSDRDRAQADLRETVATGLLQMTIAQSKYDGIRDDALEVLSLDETRRSRSEANLSNSPAQQTGNFLGDSQSLHAFNPAALRSSSETGSHWEEELRDFDRRRTPDSDNDSLATFSILEFGRPASAEPNTNDAISRRDSISHVATGSLFGTHGSSSQSVNAADGGDSVSKVVTSKSYKRHDQEEAAALRQRAMHSISSEQPPMPPDWRLAVDTANRIDPQGRDLETYLRAESNRRIDPDRISQGKSLASPHSPPSGRAYAPPNVTSTTRSPSPPSRGGVKR